jgi:type II secretory pathway component PulF
MSVFAYTALSKDGRRTSGTLAADSRAAAIVEMGKQGLHPVQLTEAKDSAAAAKVARARSDDAPAAKVSAKAIETFTRELANLLAGGVPLSRALSLLRREAAHAPAKQLWTAIHDDVVGGTSLADAMAKYPHSFSTVYIAMIRAGEAGGFLDVVLAQIADFRVREQDLKGKVKMAMVYPILLGCLAVAVVIFLMTFFIPRFSGIFEQFGSNLPVLTRAIIFISHLIAGWPGIITGGVLLVTILTLRTAAQTDGGRRKIETAML